MATYARPPAIQRVPRLSARLQTDPAGVIEAPSRPNPGIVIHVGRSVAITCTRASRRHRGTSVHGDVDIIPGGVSSRWELEDEDTALILGVSDALLRRISEESGQDTDRVEIINRFQIRDPQLEHIGWAVKTEMESGFLNGDLYLDGLATAVAVHLLKRHWFGAPSLSDGNARLSGHRLRRALAHIEDHRAQNRRVRRRRVIAEEMLELLGSPTGGGKEGERRLVGVMVKDSKRYAATGGWGFGSFDGDTLESQLNAADRQACFACHIPRKDHGYVFSSYQER